MIPNLSKHQRVHHSVALYHWQISMRLASQISALKKRRANRRRKISTPPLTIEG